MKDSDMVAGMVNVIRYFVRDSFVEDSPLKEFELESGLRVLTARGRHAYLAAAVRGHPPRELHTTFEETIESIHVLKGSALAKFERDAAVFESLRPELQSCLRAQYSAAKRGGRTTRAWLFLTVTAALIAAGIILAVRSESKWKEFVRQLKAQPEIVVTEARKGWFAPSRVSGLRDAAAIDPAIIARNAALILAVSGSIGKIIWPSMRRACSGVSSSASEFPMEQELVLRRAS